MVGEDRTHARLLQHQLLRPAVEGRQKESQIASGNLTIHHLSVRRAIRKPIGPWRWNWPIPHDKAFRSATLWQMWGLWATLANPNATRRRKNHESAYENETVRLRFHLTYKRKTLTRFIRISVIFRIWGAIRESNPFMSGSQPDVFTVSPIAPAGILYTSPYPPSRPNLARTWLFAKIMREAGKGEAEEGQFPSFHQQRHPLLRHSRVAFLDFLWG